MSNYDQQLQYIIENYYVSQLEYSSKIFFLIKNGANPDQQDIDNNTILIIISKYDNFWISMDITKFIIKMGANPNIKNIYGRTALMYLCMSDCTDDELKRMHYLMKNNADPNICDIDNKIALMYLLSNSNMNIKCHDILSILILRSDLTIVDKNGDNSHDIFMKNSKINFLSEYEILLLKSVIKINNTKSASNNNTKYI